MTSTTPPSSVTHDFHGFLARFLALTPAEWQVVQKNPTLTNFILFGAVAIIYSAIFFSWALYNTARALFGYPMLSAALFGLAGGLALATIDRHIRIQMMGAPEASRSMFYKVRVASIVMVIMSSFLIASHAFRDDIARKLDEEKQATSLYLSSQPDFADVLAARKAVEAAAQSVARVEQIRVDLNAARSSLNQENALARPECAGHAPGNVKRIRGCGPLARGHMTEARRLEQDIQALEGELAQAGDVQARLREAQSKAAAAEKRLDDAASVRTKGGAKKLEALFELMASSAEAVFAVSYWIVVSILPDAMVFIALSRSSNDADMLELQRIRNEAFAADLQRHRAALRAQSGAGLATLEVAMAPPRQADGRPHLVASNDLAASRAVGG